MGVSLLVPAFLAGLAALAIPIYIHLTHRERRQVLNFPSLMFLTRIPHRSIRRQKLRNLLLFTLRAAAVILLVMAFSRPFLERADLGSHALLSAREVVMLIDQSYSMGYGDRWARAREAAHDVVRGLGPEDRLTLAFFDDHARAATTSTGDGTLLHAAIDDAEPGARGTRYAPALRLARSTLERTRLPRREVVLISDYQRVGWEDRESVQLPEGTDLTVVPVADPESDNVVVSGVSVHRDMVEGRERVIVAARVAHRGPRAPDALAATLELDGQLVATATATLEANASTLVAFDPVLLPEGTSRARVRVGSDALEADNAVHFMLESGQGLSALVVESERGRSDRSLFVRRALAASDRPPISVDVERGATLPAAELEGRSLIILNDAPVTEPAVARALQAFVEGGGGLLVALGAAAHPDAWSSEAVALLPAVPGVVVDSRRGARLASLDHTHPAFELFRSPRSGDFSAARFFRYRAVEADTAAEVLARFDDGSPALLERRWGDGVVLLWTSTLDRFWNDFAVQPVYVPFLHQIARYAAGFGEEELWFTVGRTLDLSERPELAGTEETAGNDLTYVAVGPSGARSVHALDSADRFLEFGEPGFYEVREVDRADATRLVVAVNLDITESDLTGLDPEELRIVALAGAAETGTETAAAAVSMEDRERRQSLWWYIIVAVGLILVAETFVSNRLSRAVAA